VSRETAKVTQLLPNNLGRAALTLPARYRMKPITHLKLTAIQLNKCHLLPEGTRCQFALRPLHLQRDCGQRSWRLLTAPSLLPDEQAYPLYASKAVVRFPV